MIMQQLGLAHQSANAHFARLLAALVIQVDKHLDHDEQIAAAMLEQAQ